MKLSISFRRLTSFLRFNFAELVSASDRRAAARRFEFQINGGQHLTERLGADACAERVLAIFVLRVQIFFLRQQLAVESGQ